MLTYQRVWYLKCQPREIYRNYSPTIRLLRSIRLLRMHGRQKSCMLLDKENVGPTWVCPRLGCPQVEEFIVFRIQVATRFKQVDPLGTVFKFSVDPFRRTGFRVHHNNPRQCHPINRHSNRLTGHSWYTYSIHVVSSFWLSKYIYIYVFYAYNDQVLGLHQRGQFQWTEHLILVGL